MITITINIKELENGVVTAESEPEWNEPTFREAFFASVITKGMVETMENQLKTNAAGGAMIMADPDVATGPIEALLKHARNLPPR